MRAFEDAAVDYILKPVKRERLEQALDRLDRLRGDPGSAGARAVLEKLARHYLDFRSPTYADRVSVDLGQQRTQLVEVAKITHFVAQGKGTLDPRQFVRIHRSAIVNLAWVAEVQPDHGGHLVVRLKDGARTQLQVARDRARAFKERLVL